MYLHLVAEGSVFLISAEDRYSTFSGNRRPHTQKTFMLVYQTTHGFTSQKTIILLLTTVENLRSDNLKF